MINSTFRDTTLPRIEKNPSHYNFIYPIHKEFYDSLDFTPPADGRFFVQNYGPRFISNYDNHQGADIWGYTSYNGVVTLNPPSLCMCDGTVQYLSNNTDSLIELTTSGRTIRVECDSSSLVFNSPIHFYYRHLDSIYNLTVGMSVSKGDTLGFVGETGTTELEHLHFDYSGIPNQWGNTTDRKYLNPMRLFNPEEHPNVIGKLNNAHIEILRDWADSTLIRIHWPHNQHINRFEFTNLDYNIVFDVEEVRASYAVFEPSIDAVNGMKIFPYRTNGFRTAFYYQDQFDYPAIFPNSPSRDTNLLFYGYEHIPLTADSVVNVYDFILEDLPSSHSTENWEVKLTDVWGYTVEGKFEKEEEDTTSTLDIQAFYEIPNDFKIFPNPTNGLVNIKSESKSFGIEVFSILGEKLISKTNLIGNTSLNFVTNKISKGTYLIKISDKEGNFYSKIVYK